MKNYVFQVEELWNGQVEDVHRSMLKFYHNPSLDNHAIMSHVFYPEIGMPVQCSLYFVDADEEIIVQVPGRGLS